VASAATAVGVRTGAAAPAPRTVVFDRPYVLLITSTATGEPLFLARVADPDLP
jgi:serpin B